MNVDRNGCLEVILGNLILIMVVIIGISLFIGGKAFLNYSDPPESIISHISYENLNTTYYTPKISIVPGANTNVTLEIVRSIHGAWYSPDLKFIIKSNENGNILLEESLSKEKSWGNMISFSDEDKDEIGKASFTLEIPRRIEEYGKLKGQLVGKVTYPVSGGEWVFSEKTKNYHLNFDIQIIPESTYHADFVSNNRTKIIGSAISLVVCLPLCLLLIRYAKRNL